MIGRKKTEWVPTAELYADEFQRGPHYTNWRPRGSGDWLLIYTEAGAGRIAAGAGVRTAGPGDVLLYAPHDVHDYGTDPATGHWHLLWAHFSPRAHWHPWLQWPVVPPGLKLLRLESGEVRDRFRAAMRRMVELSRRPLPTALDLAANALEEALLWANVAASGDEWLRMDARVRKATEHLAANFREPFHLDRLARHCGLSVSRLAHLFKQETGMSPQQFHERQRMQHASRLLRHTALTVAQVAAEVGYADPAYFSNRFMRLIGRRPSVVRSSPQMARRD